MLLWAAARPRSPTDSHKLCRGPPGACAGAIAFATPAEAAAAAAVTTGTAVAGAAALRARAHATNLAPATQATIV